MKQAIRVKNTEVEVDSAGAWITALRDEHGDILFPRAELENSKGDKKLRGGCHVCAPNFGPDASGMLAQHGFGRDSEWALQSQTDTTLVYALQPQDAVYHNVQFVLTYTLAEHSLTLELSVHNDSPRPVRMAPAFHPYFATGSATTIGLNDETLNVDEYDEMKTATGVRKTLEVKGRTITLTSEELTTWALWSDRLGNYFCVEPTFGGYRFMDADLQEGEELLANGHKSYVFEIAW